MDSIIGSSMQESVEMNNSKQPSNKTLAKAITLFGGTQVFSVLAALLRSKVAAVTIGAVGVGLNAQYVAFTNLFATLFGFGLANGSVPMLCQAEGDEQIRSVANLRLVGFLLALASIPVTLIVSLFYSAESVWLMIPVALMVLSGIEMAVMKSLKATRLLTLSLITTAFISVIFTIPFFLWLRLDGVIWAVVCTMSSSALFTCYLGYKACPVLPDFKEIDQSLWQKARPLFLLGFAFLVSGVMQYATELISQRWIEEVAALSMVGLYKAGYQLAVTYTGMIFAAIANDFFPRLSGIVKDVEARNGLIVQQVRVLLCFVVPLIIVFIILVPWIVPLLFSEEFLPVVPMVRIAALSVIVRAFYLPLGYLPVALGKSFHYMILEIISWAMLLLGVILGFTYGGLEGVGVGLLVCNVLDLLLLWVFCHRYYGFRVIFHG